MSGFFHCAEAFIVWVGKTSLNASILIVLVFALQQAFARRRAPRLSYALGLLVLMRLVLPVAPASSLSMENFPLWRQLRSNQEPKSMPLTVESTATGPVTKSSSGTEMIASAQRTRWKITPLAGLFGIWAAGFLFFVGLAVWRYRRLMLSIREGVPVRDQRAEVLVGETREAMKVRNRVKLVVVPKLSSPAVFGLFKVHLLLPENMLDQLNVNELRLILIHEMTHVKRGDLWLNPVLMAVQFLHWFNPLVWIAFRRLRRDRELVCDALVMERIGEEEGTNYGRALLKLQELSYVQNESLSAGIPVLGLESEMKRRITMIANYEKGGLLGRGATAFALLALGCLTFTRAQTEGGPAGKLSSEVRFALKKIVTPEEEKQANVFYEEAMRYYLEGKKVDEFAKLNKALELNPRHTEALFSRGCLYGGWDEMERRDYAKAIIDYSVVLELEPKNCSARHNRALCYESLREKDKAIADYTFIISGKSDLSRLVDGEDKGVSMALQYRGRVYFSRKEYAKAVADFNEALRLDPDCAKPEAGGRIILRRAQAYQKLKEYAKAEDGFIASSKIDGDFDELWQSWAWLLATCPDAKFRDGAKALEYAYKTADMAVRAAAYAETGRFDQAVKCQLQAIEAVRSAPEAETKALRSALALYQANRPMRD